MTQAPDAREGIFHKMQEKQREFMRASEDEVLYGGAAYGGKSFALLAKMIVRREKWPGSAGVILRRHLADLTKEGALIPTSMIFLKGKAAWRGDEFKWTWPNGSVLKFGYMDKSDDRYGYQGTAWEDIGWEELTQFPSEDDFNFVNAFCRSKIAGCKPLVSATTNPGGRGHGWVKRRYVSPHPQGGVHTIKIETSTGIVERSRRFIPATLEDNPIGMERNPGYEATLLAMGGDLARALRHGDWDIAEGMVFADVWRPDLHVIEPFKIPADWTRWTGTDYGFANPFCNLWAARSPDKTRVVIYRELYATGLHAQAQAAAILNAEKGDIEPSMRVGDPSMWQIKHETIGVSFADIYRDAGVVLTRANNARIIGLDRVRKNLSWKRMPDGRLIQPPRLQIFNTCPNLIREIGELPYDDLNPEDCDTEASDHAYDALRYLCMADQYRFIERTVPPNINVSLNI